MKRELREIKFSNSQQRSLYVTWTLHNFCNYRCSYCPPGCHGATKRPYDTQDVIRFAKETMTQARARGFPRQAFAFSGGEPTLFPGFETILKEITAEGGDPTFTSNGGRRLEWWREAMPHFNHCVLSFHPEFANPEHFSKLVELLSTEVWVNVDFMMTKENFAENIRVAEGLKMFPNVCIDYLPIQKNFGGESQGLIDYTQEQLNFLNHRPVFRQPSSGAVKEKMERKKFFGRGRKFAIYTREGQIEQDFLDYKSLIIKGDNAFRGWACWAGTESFIVDLSGEIYRAYCMEGGSIGNIREPFRLPVQPVTCGQKLCKCSVDIEISKSAPREAQWSLQMT